MTMNEYNFTVLLRLSSPDEDGERHLESLVSGGCDDATVSLGRRGYLHLDFGREASSALEAISSATADALAAVPGADVVTVGPDLVNLTELAELMGCSRQNMRRYPAGEAQAGEVFPAPVNSGDPALWHLVEVLPWLERNTSLRPMDPLLAEVAEATFAENRRHQELRASRTARQQTEAVSRALMSRIGHLLDREMGRPAELWKAAACVARLAGRGTVKTKLNKLLFYADFRHCAEFGASISGLRYVRLPYGPVPDGFARIFSAVEDAGVVSSFEEMRGSYIAEVIKRTDVDLDAHLSSSELAVLDSVRRHFERTDANTIVEISHREPAWLETPPSSVITYSFSRRLVEQVD